MLSLKGQDSNLKPMLLMSHIDVVPIEEGTESDWTYPPFSGAVKDGYIWGRGTLDVKSGAMSIMEAVEYLLSKGKIYGHWSTSIDD
jgi:carboxypeptidase PM20D1